MKILESKRPFGDDLLSSFVVFMVALPLCMGIAIASGVPPALGIITGIIGGTIVGFLSGAPLQVSGPAAGLAVIVLELVTKHGVKVLGPILLVAGLAQVICGLLKWGRTFRAIAPPVVYGMLAGIGVLILGSQFHVMLDDSPKESGWRNLISIPEAIYKGIFPIDGSKHELAALIGISTIALLMLWSKFKPKKLSFLPAQLVGVGIATIVADVLQLDVKNVQIPDQLLSAASWPSMDTLTMLGDWRILGSALALAFVASTETMLSAVAVDRLHQGERTNFDRELWAQGVGNFVCGIFGALPMTGVIVRSSVNVAAGAKTRMSTIFHGMWLLAFVLILPDVLRKIPTSALAAILVHTGYKLIDPANVRRLLEYGRFPVVIYGVTLVGIVATDLLTGVLLGVALTIVRLVYQVSHLRIKTKKLEGHRVEMYLEGAATFIGLPKIAEALEELPPGTELHVHVDRLTHIDHACMDLLENWEEQGAANGSSLKVEWDELLRRHHRTLSAPSKPVVAQPEQVAAQRD